jgi:protein-S-isoprenylcysteine O-methyltransferase Ste14
MTGENDRPSDSYGGATKDNPGVIAFPPLIWAVTVAASLLVHFFVVRVPMLILSRPISLGIGIVLFMIAPLIAISAVVTFKKAGTNVHPSEPATTIVRGGPYRFTRNPMYLALMLLQIGVAFLLNDAITLLFAAALAVIFHFGVILREERYLEAKFGEEYLALKRSVRRWI